MSDPKPSSGSKMEIPEIAIVQAEAAVTANQYEDAGPSTESLPNSKPVPTVSEESNKPSVKHDHTNSKENQTSAVRETPIEQIPQLPFGSRLGQVDFSQDGFDTKAKVAGMLTLRTSR